MEVSPIYEKIYSGFTAEDFSKPDNYELYGFIADMKVSNDEACDRLCAALDRANALDCGDTYKLTAEPLLAKREFISSWSVSDSFELLDPQSDIFPRLIDLAPHERPLAESILRGQARKFDCEKEFNALLRRVYSESAPRKKYPSYISVDPSGRAKVVPPLLAKYIRENSHYFFINDDGGGKPLKYWYIAKKGVYRRVSDNEIKGFIKGLIEPYGTELVDMNRVDAVFRDIVTDRKFVNLSELNSDENIINFENGLLNLADMKLMPHSPDVLSTIQIPCQWQAVLTDKHSANHNATRNATQAVLAPSAAHTPSRDDDSRKRLICGSVTHASSETNVPKHYDAYMNHLTGGNRELRNFLEEFMGVALSNVRGYRMKKALFMVGKGGSGKTQLKELVSRLLGADNVCTMGIGELEESRFATSQLMGKRLVGSSDMSFDDVKSMELFKSLTGGDTVKAEIKCGGYYNLRYDGVVWNAGNKMPRFGGDKGRWVYERMAIVRCDNVVPEARQDHTLLDKMLDEREEIIAQCIFALKRVIDNGYKYDIPDCCKLEADEYKSTNSSVITFYKECCRERAGGKISDDCTCAKLYRVFKAWHDNNYGGRTPNVRNFRLEIADYLGVEAESLVRKIMGTHYYVFTLDEETKKDYTCVYGYDCSA